MVGSLDSVPSLRTAVATLLTDPQDVALAQSIMGTADVDAIAMRVEGYVHDMFGHAVVGCPLFSQSVGAIFILDLGEDRIVLKAHAVDGGRPRAAFGSLRELEAVYDVQTRFADHGWPCARVLRAPRPWPGGAVAAMTFLDAPAAADPHTPQVRRAMAEALAESVTLAESFPPPEALPRAKLAEGSVFGRPHNVLFDFATAGGEWIDARARVARAVLDELPEHRVVMHTDFSAANVRVAGGRVVAVFDMDSIALTDEMRTVASAAVHFTYLGDSPWTWPSREEASAFVRDYVHARGRPLDDFERRRLDAAAIYALAYTARCEHSLDPRESKGAPMRSMLRAAPDAYFES